MQWAYQNRTLPSCMLFSFPSRPPPPLAALAGAMMRLLLASHRFHWLDPAALVLSTLFRLCVPREGALHRLISSPIDCLSVTQLDTAALSGVEREGSTQPRLALVMSSYTGNVARVRLANSTGIRTAPRRLLLLRDGARHLPQSACAGVLRSPEPSTGE